MTKYWYLTIPNQLEFIPLKLVGSCSTVWIVTEINRAAAEKETWEILKSARSHIGNGGQCQRIHFICTKSDLIEDSDDP